MAKSRAKPDAEIVLEFVRTGNPWIDAGIVGLYRILNGKPSYADGIGAQPDEAEASAGFSDVVNDLQFDRFVITGRKSQVQACLDWAYDRLIATYFNKSSEKQRTEKGSYNFYYDTTTNDFVTFPKVKSAGVASLLFDKAARPSRGQIAWGSTSDGTGKPVRTAGRMPPDYAHLQEHFDTFLKTNCLKPGPPAGLLLDGPNEVRPKVDIRVEAKAAKTNCFLSGNPEAFMVEAKETAFPLMGGSRSFINGNGNWPRLGWKVDYVGKFVPAVAFFFQQGDDLHVFFPESADLRRIDAMADSLQSMVNLDPYLYRNFDLVLGPKKLAFLFQGRSEVALAFLHRVFVELSRAADVERVRVRLAAQEEEMEFEDDDTATVSQSDSVPETEPEPFTSAEMVFQAVEQQGHISFAVVSARKKGNVWMARDFWSFQDVVYVALLFELMKKVVHHETGKARSLCSLKALFTKLVDFEAKAEARTLLRNRVCAAVLKREGVLTLIERHAFHINSHTDASKVNQVGALLDFAKLYEVELRKETPMETSYTKMVATADWLGRNIGDTLAKAVNDKERNESRGSVKGSLFQLRKARTVGDFTITLASLQLRYEHYVLEVPTAVFDGTTLSHESFEEFRGFCMLAALNRFLFKTRESKTPNPATK